MTTPHTEVEAEQRRIRARIEELQAELNTLQARLHELTPAQEQRPTVLHPHIRIVAAAQPRSHETVAVQVVSGVEQKAADPLDQLRGLPRGSALFGFADGGSGRAEVAILVRGESRRFAALAKAPDLQLRAGVLTLPDAGVALVPVVVRLGASEEPENLYEAWVNQSAAGLEPTLQALAAQEYLLVHLHGDDCRLERVLRVPNPLKTFAGEALSLVGSMRSLSADELHQARAAVYNQCPTVRSLWRALQA
jgi:hypothetical protein